MSNSALAKINLSSLQVLKTLSVLLSGNYKMSELVQKLNANERDSIFNSSVISKYINTCRYCGIEINKQNNKYFLVKMPFGINFTEQEALLLENIQRYAYNKMSTRSMNILESFFNKLSIYTNKTLHKFEKVKEKVVFDVFENAIKEEQKIFITLNNKDKFKGIPLAVTEKRNKVYFEIIHNNEKKLLAMDNISSVELSNERFCRNLKNNEVIFVLKGGLAKRYTLREHEKVLTSDDNSITIINNGENQDELISRLLRYDSYCEVTQPLELREKIKNIINLTLKNYGE